MSARLGDPVNDDFDRWLELELDHSLAAVTREPAPPRAAGAAPRWRPGMILRPVVAAAGAKVLMGGAAAVLAAGALAGVAVTHHSASPAHPTPGISAPSGTAPRADSGDPSASPAAGGQNDQHGQGDQSGHGQGDGGDNGNGKANGNGPHPTPANTPNGVSGNGNGNNGQGDRGNSGAAHSPGPNSSPHG